MPYRLTDEQKRQLTQRIALRQSGLQEAINKANIDAINRTLQTGERIQANRAGAGKGAVALGAIAGSAALAPFTGGASLAATLATLGTGAAVGGGIGETTRQLATGRNPQSLGYGEIAKEAAISGALEVGTLGAGKAIGAGIKGSQAARAAKAVNLTDDAFSATSKGLGSKVKRQGIRDFFKLKSSDVKPITQAGKDPFKIGKKVLDLGVKNYDDAIGTIDDLGRGGKIATKLDDLGKQLTPKLKGRAVQLDDFYDDMLSKSEKLRKAGDLKRAEAILDQVDEIRSIHGATVKAEDALEIKRALDSRFGKAIASVDDLAATRNDIQKAFGNSLRKQLKLDDDVARILSDQQDLILGRELVIGARNAQLAGTNSVIRGMTLPNIISRAARSNPIALRAAGAQTGGASGGLFNALRVSPAIAGAAGTVGAQTLGRSLVPTQDLNGDGRIDALDSQIEADMQEFSPQDVQPTAQPATLASALGDPSVQQQLLLADLLDPNSQGSNISKLQAIFELSAQPTTTDPYQNLTTGERTAINDIQAAEGLVDQLESNVAAVGLGSGLGRYVEGAKDFIGAKLQTNPEAAAFEQTRGALATLLIRAIGEKGTLAEGDVKRAVDLIPRITDNQETAAFKLQALRDIFTQRKTTLLDTAQRAEGSTDLQGAVLEAAGLTGGF